MDRGYTIQIEKESMPVTINAFTVKQESPRRYIVALNSNKSRMRQLLALLHELGHILHRDFDRDNLTADQIEAKRHRLFQRRRL